MTTVLITLGVTVGLLVVGGLVGRQAERRHLKRLDAWEAGLTGFPVTDLKAPVPGFEAHGGRLVMGEAVIAADYLKTFLAGLRGLIGGEMRTYQSLLSRARREARRRAVEEALRAGATALVNIRYETSNVGSGPSVEVFCYGTAMLPAGQ